MKYLFFLQSSIIVFATSFGYGFNSYDVDADILTRPLIVRFLSRDSMRSFALTEHASGVLDLPNRLQTHHQHGQDLDPASIHQSVRHRLVPTMLCRHDNALYYGSHRLYHCYNSTVHPCQ